jgi:hypothetical protein
MKKYILLLGLLGLFVCGSSSAGLPRSSDFFDAHCEADDEAEGTRSRSISPEACDLDNEEFEGCCAPCIAIFMRGYWWWKDERPINQGNQHRD